MLSTNLAHHSSLIFLGAPRQHGVWLRPARPYELGNRGSETGLR